MWKDSEGQAIKSGLIEASFEIIPGLGPGLLGEKDFTKNEDSELQKALDNEITVDTYQEFLSDAQTSTLKGKLRRAILEIAIAWK